MVRAKPDVMQRNHVPGIYGRIVCERNTKTRDIIYHAKFVPVKKLLVPHLYLLRPRPQYDQFAYRMYTWPLIIVR